MKNILVQTGNQTEEKGLNNQLVVVINYNVWDSLPSSGEVEECNHVSAVRGRTGQPESVRIWLKVTSSI